jgi:D-arabinose 1-dehydrogenase-like Zn-dependent alcohol dehydrogenase
VELSGGVTINSVLRPLDAGRAGPAGGVRVRCETYALDEAAEALGRLKRGEIRARAVLVPGS